MKVKDMYQIVMDLVGLEFMPEDSGIVYDNGKDVKRVLAGIDMDNTMLMIAKQLGFDCVAQHHRHHQRPHRRSFWPRPHEKADGMRRTHQRSTEAGLRQ